ncbi:MAG TPA: hypothetical protein EYN69_05780, partial [Flavobacteriales bacterium]|nr:hypothetical protein [Flavobacteriales bacterium]
MEKEDFYPNDRKLRSKTVLLFIFFIVPAFNSYGQCDNGTNFYPSATYTPAVGVWAPATASNYAGHVIKVNVKIGDVYQFSTCSGYGGVSASYNTELTLSQTDGTLLTYSDDYSGCGYQSYISWTATFTGVVHLHLNAINIHTHCSSNSITTQVMIFRSIANADFIWTGAVSVYWNNGGNWDQGGLLPTAANNCIIPYTLSNNPVVDAIAVCKDLLSAGSFTVMPNGQLNVNGKLTDSLGFINVSSG